MSAPIYGLGTHQDFFNCELALASRLVACSPSRLDRLAPQRCSGPDNGTYEPNGPGDPSCFIHPANVEASSDIVRAPLLPERGETTQTTRCRLQRVNDPARFVRLRLGRLAQSCVPICDRLRRSDEDGTWGDVGGPRERGQIGALETCELQRCLAGSMRGADGLPVRQGGVELGRVADGV